jgi:glycosyltransferase involved in cell wall biosynthesis
MIHSEAPQPDLPRSVARRAARNVLGRSLIRGASGVLPVSNTAAKFYARLGVAADSIYPFGYFRSLAHRIAPDLAGKTPGVIDIIYAGQLVERKGLDLLLEALRPLVADYPELRLTLIGDGALRPRLESEVDAANLTGHMVFAGSMPPHEVLARIAQADLLVLPSRWDGWGVVVNEAYLAGVPVIVSVRCGASDAVRHGRTGLVFRSGNVEELRRSLVMFLENHSRWPAARSAALKMGESLSTEAVAPYLVACLRHMTGEVARKPRAPWLGEIGFESGPPTRRH